MERHAPITPKFPHLLHGGDYNPEQWIDTPKIWDEDMRLMKLAKCNVMTMNIFAWSTIEPEEGRFDFSYLDTMMDKTLQNGARVVLATPSGARPAWLSEKYPEALRADSQGRRQLFGSRHNHCFTSPVYREKVYKINNMIAARYKDHEALIAWHISNEYGGECHCALCQSAFRAWLKGKYGSLDTLNFEWWGRFWSHSYTSWEQINPPSPIGETRCYPHTLDWKRFVTFQTIDFMKNEIAAVKSETPDIPVTTNFMGVYQGLDYWKMAKALDVVSWDNYPVWHHPFGDRVLASRSGFTHDLNRCLKDKPFLMMESAPSATNWAEINKLKRPGMHKLSSIQAVAHGSDSVQYFQWRAGRNSSEQFHGAVVDHCGHEHTRVFRDVTEVGKTLEKIDEVLGCGVRAEAAVYYDWENSWIVGDIKGFNNARRNYLETCRAHYDAFWRKGVNVDIINAEKDFSKYKLIAAPMLYMTDGALIKKIEDYVKSGGTFVATYLSAMVNENNLCWLGGFPANQLKEVFGLWAEEIDALYEDDVNFAVTAEGREYAVKDMCALIHPTAAQTLATYKNDFYAGQSALCKNRYGGGAAYYIAFRDDGAFTRDFYGGLIDELNIKKALGAELPAGVTAHSREARDAEYVFVQNYNPTGAPLTLGEDYLDLETGESVSGEIRLEGYGVRILKRRRK